MENRFPDVVNHIRRDLQFGLGRLDTEKPRQMKTRQLLAPKTTIQEWKGNLGMIQSSSTKNINIIIMM